jgi:hypothetical protein
MAPVHGDWLGGRINGRTVIIRLMRDPGHRSDQWAAEIDGATAADAAGLTRLHDMLRAQWPKAQSKHALSAVQEHWTERDEMDAAQA